MVGPGFGFFVGLDVLGGFVVEEFGTAAVETRGFQPRKELDPQGFFSGLREGGFPVRGCPRSPPGLVGTAPVVSKPRARASESSRTAVDESLEVLASDGGIGVDDTEAGGKFVRRRSGWLKQ